MYCITLYCVVLYCIVWHCIVLSCVVLYRIVSCRIVLCCIVSYCNVVYCIALHFRRLVGLLVRWFVGLLVCWLVCFFVARVTSIHAQRMMFGCCNNSWHALCKGSKLRVCNAKIFGITWKKDNVSKQNPSEHCMNWKLWADENRHCNGTFFKDVGFLNIQNTGSSKCRSATSLPS